MLKHILVCEDQADQAQSIKACLHESGYDVMLAANGKSGLSMAQTEKPDLIITDVLMPEMTGFQMVNAIRQDCPEIKTVPIIVLSEKASMREFFSSADVSFFIAKPYKIEELISAVGKAIGPGEPGAFSKEGVRSDKFHAKKNFMVIGVDEFGMDKAIAHLKGAGHDVFVALDENEVVEKAPQIKPDVILCEYFEDSARLNIQSIYDKVTRDSRNSRVQFVAFCKEALSMDAMKTVKDVLGYRETKDLVSKLDQFMKTMG